MRWWSTTDLDRLRPGQLLWVLTPHCGKAVRAVEVAGVYPWSPFQRVYQLGEIGGLTAAQVVKFLNRVGALDPGRLAAEAA